MDFTTNRESKTMGVEHEAPTLEATVNNLRVNVCVRRKYCFMAAFLEVQLWTTHYEFEFLQKIPVIIWDLCPSPLGANPRPLQR